MPRALSTTLILAASLLVGSPGFANDFLTSGVSKLEVAEYAAATVDFELALDAYAKGGQLDEARRAYMQMFVANRGHATVFMKAMKAWTEKHRVDSAGLPPGVFGSFGAWVQKRDALAAATVNLVHNSPDWK